MKVEIKKMGINGEGIGYVERLPVFVPQALIGELVDIQITERNARYARGTLNRILKKSPYRIQPQCSLQHICGGCSLMHLKYAKQLEYKRDILKQALIKYAQIDPRKIMVVRPSEVIFGYRNQCKLPCFAKDGVLSSGMYLPNSNHTIDIPTCIVHEKGVEQLRRAVLHILQEAGFQGYSHKLHAGIRHLVIRGFDGRYQCTLVTGEDEIPDETIARLMQLPGMHSLWQSIHTVKKTPEIFGKQMILLAGARYLPLQMDGVRMEISPRSFFQLNRAQAICLYRCVAEMVGSGHALIVEAYSGIGGISMYLQAQAKEIIGIESIKDAVDNANRNAKANGYPHVSFICADAAEKLVYLSKHRMIDVLVVDPPRSGLQEKLLTCLLKSRIRKIVYVSCNPATLGKDLAVLKQRYAVVRVQPFDMFPHTAGVESVALIVRK